MSKLLCPRAYSGPGVYISVVPMLYIYMKTVPIIFNNSAYIYSMQIGAMKSHIWASTYALSPFVWAHVNRLVMPDPESAEF